MNFVRLVSRDSGVLDEDVGDPVSNGKKGLEEIATNLEDIWSDLGGGGCVGGTEREGGRVAGEHRA